MSGCFPGCAFFTVWEFVSAVFAPIKHCWRAQSLFKILRAHGTHVNLRITSALIIILRVALFTWRGRSTYWVSQRQMNSSILVHASPSVAEARTELVISLLPKTRKTLFPNRLASAILLSRKYQQWCSVRTLRLEYRLSSRGENNVFSESAANK
jgi:hypothetical protein